MYNELEKGINFLIRSNQEGSMFKGFMIECMFERGYIDGF